MSKVKTPPEKKRNSLLKDRRNVYGECPTSSRKNITKGKQRGRRALRRAVAEELRSLEVASEVRNGDVTEDRARQRMIEHKRASFRKMPDAPLVVVLERKSKKRSNTNDNVPVPYAQVLEQWRAEQQLLRDVKRKRKLPRLQNLL